MQLHTKYRPEKLKDVVGQKAIVKSLKKLKVEGYPHAFLFIGPSGCGKTTLARIIANDVDCDPSELMEVDAASSTGIDAWRDVRSGLRMMPLQGTTKVVIVDECHMLSKSAWNSLLKDVEEPPEHVYWIFCTTEAAKVPATIAGRCTKYVLSSVGLDTLYDLVSDVVEAEKMKIDVDIIWEIVEFAAGSPRNSLTGLAAAHDCSSVKEAREVLAQVDRTGEIIEICRGLARGDMDWKQACGVLQALPKPHNPEGLRHVVQGYFTPIALKSGGGTAAKALAVLEAFSKPYPMTTSLAPFLLSLGELLINDD